jgi:hypothetical protein
MKIEVCTHCYVVIISEINIPTVYAAFRTFAAKEEFEFFLFAWKEFQPP